MSALILLVVPGTIAFALLLDKALGILVDRKYSTMLRRQYFKGVNDTRNEQRLKINQLRNRISFLESQVRRMQRPFHSTTNGARP